MNVHFHGGAQEVGGSCIGVETDNAKVALDYGIRVGKEDPGHLPQDFDVVMISHAHLDHSGNLLSLSKGRPVIVGSEITREVTAELLRDMIRIRRANGHYFPYTTKDVANIETCWWTRNSIALPGMSMNLHPAGHVAGANMISIEAERKKVLYTGDFCLHDTEILEGSRLETLPKDYDALIAEATYGGTARPRRTELVDQFLRQILVTIERKGNVLIPAFAFHRMQEIAKTIDRAMEDGRLPNYSVYVISNLARKITQHFNRHKQYFNGKIAGQRQPFNYRHVKRLRRTEQIKEPAIAICTSGFGHAGASLHLLTEWAQDENNSVVISSGYLPPESPLKVAREKRELINGTGKIPVKAEIEQIELSGHADQNELVQLVETLNPKKTFLVHGEPEQAKALSEKISEMTEVYIPNRSETYAI